MNRIAVALFIFLAVPGAVLAQMSGESEAGSDGKGGSFFSQYVFYDWKHANLLTRYFVVNGVLQLGEFSLGPTFQIGSGKLALQFGADTDRDIQLAGYFAGKLAARDLLWIADEKLVTQSNRHSTLYQKLFFALNKKGNWQFRAEELRVGHVQGFLRLGAEYRHSIGSDNCQLAFAPFYDPQLKAVGGQIDFRFFNLRPHRR